MIKAKCILFLILFLSVVTYAQRPSLTLTKDGVEKIKSNAGLTPLFDNKITLVKSEIDQAIADGIDVPVPKDMAGGYTHEQHKRNYKLMHKAGNLYQFTGNTKYAEFVKEMLFEYSQMYATLPLHPTMKSYATGKIFWQCLNDANWLVFTSQAYDCVYDYLSESDRNKLETELFVPFANFLSEGNPRFFNRIHNHSTWANAAVGLMALAMNNDTLLQKALYGLEKDGIDPSEVDNDGGYIKKDGIRQAGFLAQLDYSFSPEGYFSEGPYYQRYAIFPFLVFSHALHNNRPDLKIFEYRDGILKKATNALLQLTDPQGNFFPINDSQKGMSYKSYELVTAVDLMYSIDKKDNLLQWAALQEDVAFNESGFFVAQALSENKPDVPKKKSIIFGDGVNGDEGAISVLRIDDTELLFKFAAQGMGHGHFDRLSYSLHDKAGEVIQDYGAVRWVNVDQKGGGRYLPENKTFGKQTVGHNTIVVNETSQFSASVKNAEKVTPELNYYDFSKTDFKVVSAIENNAYHGVDQQRTLMLFSDPEFPNPLVLDLFLINSETPQTLDLPFWYQGHFMKTNCVATKSLDAIVPLGEKYGYQHIWKESSAKLDAENFKFNWFGNNQFYTLHGVGEKDDTVIFGRAGANDPNFNLRPDPVVINRKKNATEAIFFNIVESHGSYSTITEIPTRPYGQIENTSVEKINEAYYVCSFSNNKYTWNIFLSSENVDKDKAHAVTLNGKLQEWEGPYKITKIKK